MTSTHKPARVDTLRHFAKCACGERFKGSDYSDKLSRHLNDSGHVGTVTWSYSGGPGPCVSVTNAMNEEMSQNDLDDALSTFAGPHDGKGNPDVDWDSDATGFKPPQADIPILPDTPRERMVQMHRRLFNDAYMTMTKKNEDYATIDDPFANFRTFGSIGFLVRMSDKFARLRNYEQRGEFSIGDEKLYDTCMDLCNYVALYYCWKMMEGGK